MHVTLHLTDQCNLDCSYCVHEKRDCVMSETVLNAACDYIFQSGTTAGICFFGGEPLLEKGLLQKAVTRCQQHTKETGIPFQCKMTTNGTLLDKDFIQYAKSIGMHIGLSFDGTGQDRCRRYRDGSGTFSDLERNAKLLLEQLPNSYAMMTIAPEAVDTYTDSVKYLYRLGFRNMNATLAYGKRVHWTDVHLEQLQTELQKTADFYEQQFLQGTPFYFGTFDGKIQDSIRGHCSGERCHLGLRQMPVTPDGSLYPCTQFINDPDYLLGDVFHGLDKEKVRKLIHREATPNRCQECALKNRCTNACGCMNRLETGDENQVSPLQCTYERMLIATCDAVANRMMEQKPEAFLKKFA